MTAQANPFGMPWYFKATETSSGCWTLAYVGTAAEANLTVTTKADGAATVAGKLGAYAVSASSYLSVNLLGSGALKADFTPVVTVGGVKKTISIETILWFDYGNDHEEGCGTALRLD